MTIWNGMTSWSLDIDSWIEKDIVSIREGAAGHAYQ